MPRGPQGAAKIRWFSVEPGNMLHAADTYEDATVVSGLKQDASPLLVLEASGLDRIATVRLPRRVTGGIHGSWIPGTGLDASDS
jgi:carotenoid cleavage dioxygenase-like enzyme